MLLFTVRVVQFKYLCLLYSALPYALYKEMRNFKRKKTQKTKKLERVDCSVKFGFYNWFHGWLNITHLCLIEGVGGARACQIKCSREKIIKIS